MNINGYWQGTIIYGADYGPEIEGKELFFEITLHDADGELTGNGRDTGGYGNLPDETTVSGFWDGETISFIKKYKYFYSFDENYKIIKDETKKPDEINYTGTYNSEKQLFEGEWEIILNTEELIDGWGEEFCGGTWSMRR